MDYFGKLPEEIQLEILSRLPSDSILHCKLVRKSWRNVISQNRSFPQLHLHHVNQPSDSGKLGFLALTDDNDFCYFEYNDESTPPIESIRMMIIEPADVLPKKRLSLVGSCNGLVCFASRYERERPVCICNPFTKECVVLPEIRTGLFHDFKGYFTWSFGFGYVSLTNEYKVVGICVLQSEYVHVYTYTLGSGTGWRSLGKFDSEFRPGDQCDSPHGIFANGAIYWVGVKVNMILTFDLIQEKFCEHLAPPTLPPNTDLYHHTVGVLDGLLYTAILDEEGEAFFFDIWLLKKKNDNEEKKEHQSLGWSKEFRVDEHDLLAVTKSGDVLLYTNYEFDLDIYNTKSSTSKRLLEFEKEVSRIIPHRNTFISLKGLGE